MLPSVTQPLGSLASGAALPITVGVEVARSAAKSGDMLATTLSSVDSLVGTAQKAGLLAAGAPAAKTTKPKSSGAGYAKSTSASKSSSATVAKKSSTAAKKSGPLAFLDDRNLSIEDKLMRLLAYLNDKWEKDLDKKMKEMSPAQSSASSSGTSKTSTSSTSKKESGGILGSVTSLVKAAKKFFPEVGIALDVLQSPVVRAAIAKFGGPVLAAAATAVGMPALAPALLKYGPQVVDLAAGIASGLVDETKAPSAGSGASASSAGSSSGSAAAATQGSALSDGQERLKLMEIQRIYDKQKEMFSLVSNILRSAHDTRMAVIQNVR